VCEKAAQLGKKKSFNREWSPSTRGCHPK